MNKPIVEQIETRRRKERSRARRLWLARGAVVILFPGAGGIAYGWSKTNHPDIGTLLSTSIGFIFIALFFAAMFRSTLDALLIRLLK